MSAPLIWIFLPFIAAVGFWYIKKERTLTLALGAVLCAMLFVLTFAFQLDIPNNLGPLSFQVSSTVSFLGRKFVLVASRLPFLRMIYGYLGVWFLGGLISKPHAYFVPLGLAMTALLVAAIAVQPFLYAALLIEMAVLITVPLFVPPGSSLTQGVLRYVIFQTLAMPFMLYAGWAAAGAEANPANERFLLQAVFLLGLGFSFWLAVFPFYTWVPKLAGETKPYVFGFVITSLSLVILLLGFDFLNTYIWLWEFPQLPGVLRLVGSLMVATGGIWVVFERDLRRIFAYTVIVENGFSLLALGLHNSIGLEISILMFLPHLVVNFIWVFGLYGLSEKTTLNIQGIRGLMYSNPFSLLAILAGCMSIGGLPLLATFPLRQVLLENIAKESLLVVIWALAGSFGLIFSAFRMLGVSIEGDAESWTVSESWPQRIALLAGILFLFILGIVPQWFYPEMLRLLDAFDRFR